MYSKPPKRAAQVTPTVLLSLLVCVGLTACASDSGIKRGATRIADKMSAVGAHIQPGSKLIVHRRLYVTANPDETVIQKGYPADSSRVDKYEPFCRFEFDLRKLPSDEVDISTIDADTFVITRVTNTQNMSFQPGGDRRERVQVAEVSAGTNLQEPDNRTVSDAGADRIQVASSLVISSWATVFNITSEKQPWITKLFCNVMVGDDRYLTVAEIGQVLSPSASIEIKE